MTNVDNVWLLNVFHFNSLFWFIANRRRFFKKKFNTHLLSLLLAYGLRCWICLHNDSQTQWWRKFHQFELYLFDSSNWIGSRCVTRRPSYLETVKRFRLSGNRLVPLYITISLYAAFRDVRYTVSLAIPWKMVLTCKEPIHRPNVWLVLLSDCFPRVTV